MFQMISSLPPPNKILISEILHEFGVNKIGQIPMFSQISRTKNTSFLGGGLGLANPIKLFIFTEINF